MTADHDRDIAALLREAGADLDVADAPVDYLARTGRRSLRRRRLTGLVVLAAAVVTIAVGVPLTLGSRQSTPTDPPAVGGCPAQLPAAVLPTWARAGFSEATPRIPYRLGDHGRIAAILFAQPLGSPPAPDHNNKILWVARPLADGTGVTGTLRITASLVGGSSRTTRTVQDSPGPSIIDLPQPGCWHLSLHWGDRTDSMNLFYAPATG